ncbi:MAG: DUF488 domain-containing protein [Nitrososphaera sp.]
MAIKIKRVYNQPEDSDGIRVLVDRLWPRGLPKEKAQVDEWLKEIAPSGELRKWFGHKAERWHEFRQRYGEELKSSDKQELVQRLRALAKRGTVTLLFGAKDAEHNNAKVLVDVLKRR